MYFVRCLGKERETLFECATKKDVDELIPFVYKKFADCKVTIEGDSEQGYMLVHENDNTEVLYLDGKAIYTNNGDNSISDLLIALNINFEEK